MSATVSISANIPATLGEMLNKVSEAEERSKSYYIKKGLERFLMEKLEEMKDYRDAKQAYDEFLASGEKGIPFDEVFKDIK